MSTTKGNLQKLNDVKYTGPEKTYTKMLQPQEIKELLDGYEETKYDKLKRGWHVRYFSKNSKTNVIEFKIGGVIFKMYLPTYVILSNGRVTWCVQIANSIFYQQIPYTILKNNIIKEFQSRMLIDTKKYDLIINDLKTNVKNLQNELKRIKSITS